MLFILANATINHASVLREHNLLFIYSRCGQTIISGTSMLVAEHLSLSFQLTDQGLKRGFYEMKNGDNDHMCILTVVSVVV